MKKPIVDVDTFRQYTNNYEEDPEGLLEEYIRAADDIVIKYLNYDPVIQDYDEWVSGTGDYKLYLKARPIESVYYMEIGGVSYIPCNLECRDEYIQDGSRQFRFPNGVENIHIKYTAGYRNIPQVIKVAVMRIAALMLAESNGNIGLTGKAFGDQSRTFINYSNYDKYLTPLNPYRIITFGV